MGYQAAITVGSARAKKTPLAQARGAVNLVQLSREGAVSVPHSAAGTSSPRSHISYTLQL